MKKILCAIVAAIAALTLVSCGLIGEPATHGKTDGKTTADTTAAFTTGETSTPETSGEEISDAPMTDETDTPETDVVETDTPETDIPETDIPETEESATDSPATEAPHIHSYTTATTPASCTTAGQTVETCACGDVKTTVIAATGHAWGAWATVKEPTQTETGTQRRTCGRCGTAEDGTLEKLPHMHSYTAETTPASCTTAGQTVETCACGDTKTTVIAATGHAWGAWATVTPPTQTEVGTQRRTCGRCGATEDDALEKLPMSVSEAQLEVLRLVNVEREKVGLAPLSYYVEGQAAGDLRAEEIRTSFSHTRPNGSSCFTALHEVGIPYYYAAGENIALGHSTPEEVVEAWMNSDGHRANILSEHFTHLIVGVNGTVGQHGVAWVQLFLGVTD